MKNNKKKIISLSIISVCAVLLIIGVTFALQRYSSSTVNKISTGTLATQVVEEYTEPSEVYPGQTIEKKVNVKNTGGIDQLVRVKVEKKWGSSRAANGSLVQTDSDKALSTDNIVITYNTAMWLDGGDGYYYYKAILSPNNETTTALFENFQVSSTTGNEYKNKIADIDITVEAIQTQGDAIEDLWGKSYADLGITPPTVETNTTTTLVTYINPETKFTFSGTNGDLFSSFKTLQPGETRTQTIKVTNNYKNTQTIYLKAELAEQEPTADLDKINDLIKNYVTITIKEGTDTKYSGPIWGNLDSTTNTMANDISLGSYTQTASKNLTVSLSASKTIPNDYQNLVGNIKWTFSTDETDGTVLVHHYMKNSETKLAPDETLYGEIGQPYTTSPAEITGYKVATPEPTNKTGVYAEEETVVTYYYERSGVLFDKDPAISKTATNEVTSSNDLITYNITYSAVVKEYSGDATLTITDTLPQTIDTSYTGTNLAGGTYNATNKTITWTVDLGNVDTYTNGNFAIDFTKEITVKYTSLDFTGKKMVNTVTAGAHFISSDETVTRTATTETSVNVKGTVVTEYLVKGTNKKLNDNVTTEGNVGDPYTTDAKAFPGYDIETPANATGNYIEGEIKVTYYYTAKEYNLIAHHYLAGTTTKLADDVVTKVKFDDTYKATSLSTLLTNYTVNTPSNAEGTVTGDITVNFEYTPKNYTITVHHYLVGTTTKLADDVVTQSAYSSPYTTSPSNTLLTNYTVNTPSNKDGTTTGDTVVTYYYTPKGYTVTTHHYKNGTTEKVADDVVETKQYNDTYTTTASSSALEHYTQANDPANKSGTVTANIEVIYYYTPKNYTITVHHYKAGTTDKLIEDEVRTIAYDESYTTSSNAELVKNYTVNDPANKNGKITGDITVTYEYTPKNYTLTVRHILIDKNTVLSPEEVSTVKYGDAYTTSPNATVLQHYVETDPKPTNATGTVEGDTIVIYYYTEKEYTLTVHHYIQGTTTPIIEDQTTKIKYNVTYTTAPDENILKNYNLGTPEPTNKEGTITGDTVVTYYYTPKGYTVTTHHYKNGTTEKVADDVVETKQYNDTYTTTASSSALEHYTQANDPANKSGTVTANIEVIYYYTPKNYTITVHHYKAGTTEKLLDDETITRPYNETYETSPSSTLTPNYTVNDPANKSGTVAGDTVVTYYYTPKTYKLTVHHYKNGTESDSLIADEVKDVTYGEHYETAPSASLLEHYTLANDPANKSGTVTGDITVTYQYTPKEYTLTVHHYLEGTTINLAADEITEVEYNTPYTTSKAGTLDDKYTVIEPANKNGTITSDIVVTYYYHLNKAEFTDPVFTKTGDDEITSKDGKINYNITYNTTIETYKGNATLTVVDTLSQTIDEANSILDGGVYDAANKTITWTVNINDINTYENGSRQISFAKTISLKYTSLDYTSKEMKNTAKATLTLGATSETDDKEASKTTNVDVKGKVTAKYLLENTETEISASEIMEGQIGTPYQTTAKQITNYRLISTPDNATGTFAEDEIIVNYYYELYIPDATNTVIKSGLDKLTSKTDSFDYSISYVGKVSNYEGEATLTIVDYLPYPLDVEKSSIDEGTYNENDLTITWITKYDIDANPYNITDTHNISLVYKDIDYAKDITNKATITLVTDKEYQASNELVTESEIAAKVIVHHYLANTSKDLVTPVEIDGIIGDKYETTSSSELLNNNYRLVEVVGETKGTMNDEETTVIYYYEKEEENPYTADNIVPYFIAVGTSSIVFVGSLAYIIIVKKKKED